MISCPSCRAEQTETSAFCSACGAALKPEYEATVTHGIAGNAMDGSVDSSPSGSSHHGRFLPGTKVADRYRIVSLVGKGGMGEVYRADDLKLGHTVALKFLPKDLADVPQRLEYFHSEVRLTRQISHPNVCRVYDIGEIDGQHFLSMEYIDGEDLKVLLRRIGRLPKDKGVEIAQQLCAGLSAAHDKGVLHRDLKPANIMIDGQGQVRITDFGLAKLAEDAQSGEVAGTPAYMAPEQLARGETTIQSDLYSLGLILFELFTGKAVHKGSSIPELLRAHEESSPSQPSQLVDDMDPVVERVILRCLEKEPHERPNSAHAVAAALPGGDPLAAALAAGETPSPQMVAAAGRNVGLEPQWAIAALVGVAVCLFVNCWLADEAYTVNQAGLKFEPTVLADDAREIIVKELGYDEQVSDEIHGFRTVEDGSMRFWYRRRTGDGKLVVADLYDLYDKNIQPTYSRPKFRFPSWTDPGELGLELSPEKRLLFFRAVPVVETDSRRTDLALVRWSAWFKPETTGFYLPGDEKEATTARKSQSYPVFEIIEDRSRTLPDASDLVAVWKGIDETTKKEIYVQAAAYRGKPTYFNVFSKEEFDSNFASATVDRKKQWWYPKKKENGLDIGIWLYSFLWIGAALLAWRNVRAGRCDLQGARRLAAWMFCVNTVAWLTLAHYIANIKLVVYSLSLGVSQILFYTSFGWVWYLAFEPMVRRIWPRILIPWSRLINGRFNDPLVGRDLLVGTLFGAMSSILFKLSVLLSGGTADPISVHPLSLAGTRELIGTVMNRHSFAVFIALYLLLLLLILRIVLRSERRAMVGFLVTHVVVVTASLGEGSLAISAPLIAVHSVLGLVLLVRFGFLAMIAAQTVLHISLVFPLTTNADHWYFGHGMFAITLFSAMALYGFYTSVGGRSFFKPADAGAM